MGAAWTSCVRYLMFFFNLVFALTGIVILALGACVMYMIQEQSYSQYISTIFKLLPIILLVIGGMMAFIAFFGCCGAAKESSCMLMSFGVLLIVLFIIEITALAAAYMYRGDLAALVENHLKYGVEKYYVEEEQHLQDIQKFIDDIQTNLNCCGVEGPADYPNERIPYSCCDAHDTTRECPINMAKTKGCFTQIEDYFASLLVVIEAVGGCIAVVQCIGIFFAFCLARTIRKGYEVV